MTATPSTLRYQACRVLKDERRRGLCVYGHALTEPNGERRLIYRSGYHLCPDCLDVYDHTQPPTRGMGIERPCRAGTHIIPAGERRCPECYRANKHAATAQPGAGPVYTRIPLPEDAILDQAACSLETAKLFDAAPYGTVALARISRAITICQARCPVAAACLAYGHKYGLTGVYGGFYLSHGQPVRRAGTPDRGPGVVPTMPSVPDSAAC